jgi:hypothetical protein
MAQEQMARAEQESSDRMSEGAQQVKSQDQNKDDQQRSGGGMKHAFDQLKQAAHEAREAVQQQRDQ